MAVTGAITAVAALGYGIYAGEEQKSAQRKAVRKQEAAQKDASATAAAQQRRAEMDAKRARSRQPDVGSLLSNEMKGSLDGPSATMLSGGGGRSAMKLGKTSMLGG